MDNAEYKIPEYSGDEMQQLLNFVLSERFIFKNERKANEAETAEQAKQAYYLISFWFDWKNFLVDYKAHQDILSMTFWNDSDANAEIKTEDYIRLYDKVYQAYVEDYFTEQWKRKIFSNQDGTLIWTGDNTYARFSRALDAQYEYQIDERRKTLYLDEIKNRERANVYALSSDEVFLSGVEYYEYDSVSNKYVRTNDLEVLLDKSYYTPIGRHFELNLIDYKRIYNQMKILTSGEYWYQVAPESNSFVSNTTYYEYKYGEYQKTNDVVRNTTKTYYIRFYSQWCDTPYDERLTWRGYSYGHTVVDDNGTPRDVFTINSLYNTGKGIKYFPSKEADGTVYWEANSANSPVNATWKNKNIKISLYEANSNEAEFILTANAIFPQDMIGDDPMFYEKSGEEFVPTGDSSFLPEKKYYSKDENDNFILAKTNQKFYTKDTDDNYVEATSRESDVEYYEHTHDISYIFVTGLLDSDADGIYIQSADIWERMNYFEDSSGTWNIMSLAEADLYYFEYIKSETARKWQFYKDSSGKVSRLEDSITTYFKLDPTTGLWHFYFSLSDSESDVDLLSDIIATNDISQELVRYSYRYYTPVSKEWTEITVHPVGMDLEEDGTAEPEYIWIENNINGNYIHKGAIDVFGVARNNAYYCEQKDTYLTKVDNEFIFSTTRPYKFFPISMSKYKGSINYIKEPGLDVPYLLYLFNSAPIKSGTDISNAELLKTESTRNLTEVFKILFSVEYKNRLNQSIQEFSRSLEEKIRERLKIFESVSKEEKEKEARKKATEEVYRHVTRNFVKSCLSYDETNEYYLSILEKNGYVQRQPDGKKIYSKTFNDIEYPDLSILYDDSAVLYNYYKVNNTPDDFFDSTKTYYEYHEYDSDNGIGRYIVTSDHYFHSDKDYFEREVISNTSIKTGFFVTTDLLKKEDKSYYIKDSSSVGTAYVLFTGNAFNTVNKQYYIKLAEGVYKKTTETVMDKSKIYYEASYTSYTALFSLYTTTDISTEEYLFTKNDNNIYERCYDTTRRYIDGTSVEYYTLKLENSEGILFDYNTGVQYYKFDSSTNQYTKTNDFPSQDNEEFFTITFNVTEDSYFLRNVVYYEAQSYNTLEKECKIAAILFDLKCRLAEDNRILSYPAILDDKTRNTFLEKYNESLYYFNKVLYSEGFAMHEKYWNLKNFICTLMAIEKMITNKLITVYDVDTFSERDISNMFASYGLSLFEVLPIKFRRRLLKNINYLLSNKGTGKALINIINIFGFDNVKLFKHYLYKTFVYDNGQGGFSKFEPQEDNLLPREGQEIIALSALQPKLYMMKVEFDKNDLENQIANLKYSQIENYEEATTIDADGSSINCDKYWQAEQPDAIAYMDNVVATKYFSFEIALDMVRNKINKSYIFDMIKQYQDYNPDGIVVYNKNISSEAISVYDLMILMYIASMKYMGFADDIHYSPQSMESLVYGFNMNTYKANNEINNRYSYYDEPISDDDQTLAHLRPLKNLMQEMGPKYFASFLVEYLGQLHQEHKKLSLVSDNKVSIYIPSSYEIVNEYQYQESADGSFIENTVYYEYLAGIYQKTSDTEWNTEKTYYTRVFVEETKVPVITNRERSYAHYLSKGRRVYADIGCRQMYGVITEVNGNTVIIRKLSNQNAFRSVYPNLLDGDFLETLETFTLKDVVYSLSDDEQKVMTTILMMNTDLCQENYPDCKESISVLNTCLSLLKTNNTFVGIDYDSANGRENGYDTIMQMINRGTYSTTDAQHSYTAISDASKDPKYLARIDSILDDRKTSYDAKTNGNTFSKVYINNMRLLNSIKEYAKKQTNIVLFQALRKVHDVNFTHYVTQRDFENYSTYTDYLTSRNPDLTKYLARYEQLNSDGSPNREKSSYETVLYEVFNTFSSFLQGADEDSEFNDYFDLMQSNTSIGYIKRFIKLVVDEFKAYTTQFKDIKTYYVYRDDYDEKVFFFDDIGRFTKTLALCSCSQHPYLNYLAQTSEKTYLLGKFRGITGFCNGTNCVKCRYGVFSGSKDNLINAANEIDDVSVFTCNYPLPRLVGDIMEIVLKYNEFGNKTGLEEFIWNTDTWNVDLNSGSYNVILDSHHIILNLWFHELPRVTSEIISGDDTWVYQIVHDFVRIIPPSPIFVDRSRSYSPYNKMNKNYLEIIDSAKMFANEKLYEPFFTGEFFKVSGDSAGEFKRLLELS